jgi:sulfatase modifying factor 1
MILKIIIIFFLFVTSLLLAQDEGYENSTGMKFVYIKPGAFTMGSLDGEWDERPVHRVTISKPFYIAITEVTNKQYERFVPDHRRRRGEHGFSRGDDEAAVFVSWMEATEFCAWLSKKEGKTYRLPTEAEWEYACRAGTVSAYYTGQRLGQEYHKNQSDSWAKVEAVPLHVAQTPPNPWGLYDMHGNVEEWCLDWYGPYQADDQKDPVGYRDGVLKVTRSGSHSTPVEYLRSANRMGTLPGDSSWMIGFRVVQAEWPEDQPLPCPAPPVWARDVSQQSYQWSSIGQTPHWQDPIPFVKIQPDSDGPLYSRHNHQPAIAWCENGDLLAVWFSCRREWGREMTVLGSRLRPGKTEWTDADVFFHAPDRNLTGSALLNDGHGKLYFFNGLSAAQGYRMMLALVMRTSEDNGATWSAPRLINPYRNDPLTPNQPIASAVRLKDGTLVLPVDAPLRQRKGGTALWMSEDGGLTWEISNGTIDGIHAAVVERPDNSLLAFGRNLGRGDAWGDRMPQSISHDRGRTWEYADSPFPAIASGQRLVLKRLREGPLLLVSFTDSMANMKKGGLVFDGQGLPFKDQDGSIFKGYGMFAAVSFDEGQTWPVQKLLSPCKEGVYVTAGHTKEFYADAVHAEPRGYLAATQTPDGIIHLISSGLHYRFNLAWLRKPNVRPD